MPWHYASEDKRVGPLEDEAIKALIASKVITAHTLVWRKGMAQWSPASDSELASLLPAAATEDAPPPLPASPKATAPAGKRHCRNCSKEISAHAVVCTACGCPPLAGKAYCQACGSATDAAAEMCTRCGVRVGNAADGLRSKMTAGLLGIFLGPLGVHRFYLGFTVIGVLQIVVTLLTFGAGGLWGVVEGVLILTGNINKDAEGQSLTD